MIKVLMFVGNEGVTFNPVQTSLLRDDHVVEVEAFTADALLPAIVENFCKEDTWLDEDITWCQVPQLVRNSFEIIGENFAQIIDDEVDGGMIYVVRL